MRTSFNYHAKFMLAVLLSLLSCNVFAQVNSAGILDDVLNAYAGQAAGWAVAITAAATWLFWLLVVISMVFTFGFMAIKKADLGEFFAEFLRFIIFTGFFWWLLLNGPVFAVDIINSLRQVGSGAAGLPNALSPSGIVDVGFDIMGRIFAISSIWEPIDSSVAILIGVIIVVVLALVGINMLLLLISAWFLAFAGVFFLGFGGSKWTSDIAVNYYKTVLGLAAQIMAMILLIGIGQNIIVQYQNNLSGQLELIELIVILVVAITLLLLTNKVPALLAGIISGASVGGQGVGQFGAGAALGATAALATAGAAAAAGITAAATNAAGGSSAIMQAYRSAQNSLSESGGGGDSGSIDTAVSSANVGSQDYNSGSNDADSSLTVAMGGGGEDNSGSITDGSALGGGQDVNTDSGSVTTNSSSTDNDSGGTSSTQESESLSNNKATDASSTGLDLDSGSNSDVSGGTSSTQEPSIAADSAQSNNPKSSMSGMAKAAAIAGHMAKSLSAGVKAHAANTMSEKIDQMKDRVSKTAGGQIAEEIKNPNAKSQAREDAKIVGKAESDATSNELSQRAAEVRGVSETPSSNEVSNFVNKKGEGA